MGERRDGMTPQKLGWLTALKCELVFNPSGLVFTGLMV